MKITNCMNAKIIATTVVLVSMLYGLSFGQWSRTSPNVYLSTSSDKVGIGANNPFNKLDIAGTVGLRDNDLLLRGTSAQDLNHGLGWYGSTKQWNGISLDGPVLYGYSGGMLGTRQGSARTNILYWNTTGVGIGTTATGTSRLAVNGTIRAKEVVVTTAGWPDFVFKPDYNLKPLKDVETFINKNNHLEGIPSEKEVTENGVSVGEMQAKLLQKLEETTLYLIKMEKENEELKARLAAIEQKVQ